MNGLSRLRSWLRGAFRRPHLNREIDEELVFHVDRYAQDLERAGIAPAEAHRRARAAIGGFDGRREAMRQALGLRLFDELRGDVRHALRTLRRSPLFAGVAILTIGLGVGANAAVFSLMESAVWRPLPVRDPQRLRLLTWTSGRNDIMDNVTGMTVTGPDGARVETAFSYAAFTALAERSAVLSDLCAFRPLGQITAVIDGEPELVIADLVSGSYYRTLGVGTVLGRGLTPADDAAARQIVGVISDVFWARRFARAPSVIGRRIDVGGAPVTIVGVTTPEFAGTATGFSPDISLPLHAQPVVWPGRFKRSMIDDPATWWLSLLGRLAPGVTEAQANAGLALALRDSIRDRLPDRLNRDQPQLRVLDGSRGVDALREMFARPLRVLLALTGAILLLTCANLANLLLERAGARRREMSLRLAIGAGRGRLVRQLLTEGLVLAALGGLCGASMGYAVRDVVPSFLNIPWQGLPLSAAFDLRVLASTVALTLAAGVLFSVAPAWESSRTSLFDALRDGGRATRALAVLGGRPFVAVQVALAAILLAGAGLFVRTLINLNHTHLGFDPDQVVLFPINPPRTQYAGASRVRLFERLEEALRGIPGVERVSLSGSPLAGLDTNTTTVGPDGRYPPGETRRAWINQVSQDFFQTMGIAVVQGRGFDAHDGPDAEPVAVINRAFVKAYFPSGEALGHMLLSNGTRSRIVGIVGDTPFRDVRTPAPATMFRPYRQLGDADVMTVEIRTNLTGTALARAVRDAVGAIDRRIPISDIRSQRAQISSTLVQERLLAALASLLGALAIVLTCIGIYAVVASAVSRRTAEIGVRLALGAQRRQVIGLVLRGALAPIGVGLVAGMAAAIGLGHFLANLLYGLEPTDPVTLAGAAGVALAASLAAALIPARRASRLSPIAALRQE